MSTRARPKTVTPPPKDSIPVPSQLWLGRHPFKPTVDAGDVVFVLHTLHVNDGWVVVYNVDHQYLPREQRTAYMEASTGHIKWDMINKAQV